MKRIVTASITLSAKPQCAAVEPVPGATSTRHRTDVTQPDAASAGGELLMRARPGAQVNADARQGLALAVPTSEVRAGEYD